MSGAVQTSLESASAPGWRASLELDYERRGTRTVLIQNRHQGPLAVQKSLYPEGDAVCQNIVVHPPGGIAGGDALHIDIGLGSGTHAQLTTPGATKWYRSGGDRASQRLAFRASKGAALEWLPQETIVFDAANADLDCSVKLVDDAVFVGWEIVCLGRIASGERFAHGSLRQRIQVWRESVLLFVERAVLHGESPLLASPVGLDGAPVFGTFLAVATTVPDDLIKACRATSIDEGEGAATRLPGLLVARYRGASTEAARDYFTRLWRCARPALLAREAVPPRIWKT